MQQKQPDRVSYSFGMKLSLPTKYESADFHVSLTSDVNTNETSVEAFNRVKKEVEVYAELAYQQIRNSEEGLTHAQATPQTRLVESNNTGDVPASAEPKQTDKPTTPENPVKRDIKILRQKIKQAYSVLEAQKKVSKADFVSKFLKNKKTDDLNELEVTRILVDLRESFPELGL